MIPYTRMGERSYRFLRLSDVTDYKRRRDEATSKALDGVPSPMRTGTTSTIRLPVPVR